MFEVFKKEHVLIAHRGLRSLYPENTLIAFEKAIKHFDMIEFDVQYTKDFEPVIFHDTYINKKTNINKKIKISDLSFEEVKKLDNVSWFIKSNPFNEDLDYRFLNSLKKEAIPSLDEVLSFITDNNIFANLEIKMPYSKNILEDIKKRVVKFKLKDQVIISSFSLEYIKELKGFYKAALFDKKVTLKEILKYNLDAFHINKENFSKNLTLKLLEKDVVTNVYTVNDKKEIENLFKNGVKGIFSDIL
ncbi:glycerophosphodiester phosphodiesterase [Caminibacter mediatlanticus]|uniref:Glycerophosphoryl diester phosphodiesterase n=1 Tax=Caminibacter mediatlanticus TB-2 TaxID=391592 RepID=A0AAI9AH51_9BACT|nr:glycerophosphodiester phosphodiesterase family protein [Caminibacter mediatlanticus]EDM23414.1 Glycerophosphoryl diester phosphodiesterase [Caminibacter mediatlanticus TB-2]